MTISFFAPGTPAPKGSHKAFPVHRTDGSVGVVVTDTSKGLHAWSDTVAGMAHAKVGPLATYPLTGAVGIGLHFYLPRPKRKVRPLPSVRPDLDKLARAVLDGLNIAGVFVDDGQVTTLVLMKEYTSERHSTPGVEVSVWPLDSVQEPLDSTATT